MTRAGHVIAGCMIGLGLLLIAATPVLAHDCSAGAWGRDGACGDSATGGAGIGGGLGIGLGIGIGLGAAGRRSPNRSGGDGGDSGSDGGRDGPDGDSGGGAPADDVGQRIQAQMPSDSPGERMERWRILQETQQKIFDGSGGGHGGGGSGYSNPDGQEVEVNLEGSRAATLDRNYSKLDEYIRD